MWRHVLLKKAQNFVDWDDNIFENVYWHRSTDLDLVQVDFCWLTFSNAWVEFSNWWYYIYIYILYLSSRATDTGLSPCLLYVTTFNMLEIDFTLCTFNCKTSLQSSLFGFGDRFCNYVWEHHLKSGTVWLEMCVDCDLTFSADHTGINSTHLITLLCSSSYILPLPCDQATTITTTHSLITAWPLWFGLIFTLHHWWIKIGNEIPVHAEDVLTYRGEKVTTQRAACLRLTVFSFLQAECKGRAVSW